MILVKIFENLDFCEDFRNAPILVTIFKNIDFGQKGAIFVKIRENLKFGPNFRKWSILFKTSRFWSKFLKISILV